MTDFPLPPPDTQDVWDRLAADTRPICIYGTGNGADKIMDELDRRGISVFGVFASDGFVREREFRGHRVVSYGEICRSFDDFVVLLAFGTSRPDVLANIDRIKEEHTLLCPDVPAFGGVIFDSSYYREHYDGFLSLHGALADDESRRVLSLILQYKLTGECSPLYGSASDGEPGEGVLNYERYETMIDLGAYSGDTMRDAIGKMPRLQRIFALEPEPHAYRKLIAYTETVSHPQIITYNAAAWSGNTTIEFTSDSGRGSSASAQGHKRTRTRIAAALAVDRIADTRIDYIKFDVEGAEAEALSGSAATIRRDRPDLLVSVYHRTEDLLTLPALVKGLCPNHKLYLRRERGVPAWGINLYAVTEGENS